MDLSLLVSALQLAVYVAVPLVLGGLGGAVIAGILRVATQIDDHIVGYTGRVAGVVLAIYLIGGSYFAEVVEFTGRIWGGQDLYQ